MWPKLKLFKSWLSAMSVLGILLMGEPRRIKKNVKGYDDDDDDNDDNDGDVDDDTWVMTRVMGMAMEPAIVILVLVL